MTERGQESMEDISVALEAFEREQADTTIASSCTDGLVSADREHVQNQPGSPSGENSKMGQADNTQAFLKWYEDHVRPFLLGHLTEGKIQDFDKDWNRLAKAAKLSDTELSVCFLGNSGVGKSTLINAIIGGAESVVPSGGVGPLAAQAPVVRPNTDN